MSRLEWLISVDDHVIEPPDVWQSRLPKRHKASGPKVVETSGGQAWEFAGKVVPMTRMAAAAGFKKEDFSPAPIRYSEMRAGCYDPRERTKDMDIDGVLASMCFPSFPRFCGQEFYEVEDKELGMLCVQAYNDWMIEDWCGAAPGRFIPLIIIPLWDPKAAASEIERTATLGAKAVAFSENPHHLGLPSIHDPAGYWDPVFSAAQETGMPICTHIGSSSRLPQTSPDAPFLVTAALSTGINAAFTLTDWLYSGMFVQFPRLKLCLSEGGIGWIPYMLERCDYTLDRQGAWTKTGISPDGLVPGYTSSRGRVIDGQFDALPSQLFKDHVYGCFIDDQCGVDNLDSVGVDNVMMESDYPHTDTSWPNTLQVAQKRLAGRSDDDIEKIFQSNARRVFNFTPADEPLAHR